jgi:cell division protein FtsB
MWGVFAMFLLTAAVAVFQWFPFDALLQQDHNIAAATESLKALKAQDATLQQQIDHLSTKEGFDQVAREQYQLVPEGQSLYLILPPASVPAQSNGGPIAYPGDPGYQPLVSPSAGSTAVAAVTQTPTTKSTKPGFFSRLLASLEFWK